MTDTKALAQAIRDVPDFPKPGIVFKDITPVLSNPELLREAIRLFADRHRGAGIDKVAGIESRGFIFAAPLALELNAGLIPIRKKGKLPHKTIEVSYELEYGEATLEVHLDALSRGERILIIDDLLATGGTAAASAALIEQLGGAVVEIDFLVELAFLSGREKLGGYPVYAPIVY
jgi:adenine phosphoribosyltransferase